MWKWISVPLMQGRSFPWKAQVPAGPCARGR